ncbi:MAG: hypothetical protein CO113_17090 [Elusimicrobia bacterium CG_4_9_14_3_um_filter_62_55]|nr:MAG: hypothetical protein COR54_15300 [Elusimicrobia bacterium CG22_combo_CG10-13_8_21_14_all_63_91]PJA13930.1 MAG: hypothetical protein COX66_13925 [Elusimicrobia bacterium CG_4_10_14_0_2_um_filter_63_34]PJB23829.1 MAG: hypothetical protein CO113_17090 [Elusimicrobia bacterium CG_4_9_14_3_um_filter_62_55]
MSSRSRLFAKNTLWNVGGQGALVALSFIVIPALIRELGKAGYALYGLMGLLSGYLYLLSFGTGNSTMKYTAEYNGSGDAAGLRAVFRMSLWTHAAGATAGAALLFLGRNSVIWRFFEVPPSLAADGAWLVGCTAVAAIFYSLLQGGNAVLQGLQRFDLATAISVTTHAALLSGSLALVRMGHGLKPVAVLYLCIQAFGALAAYALASRALPADPDPRSRKADAALRAPFLRHGFQVFLSVLAWSVAFQWDKFIVGLFFPIEQLTYYLIPAYLIQRFWVLPSSIITAAFPALSAISGAGDEKGLRSAYLKIGQLVLWLVVPAFTFLFVAAPPFLTLWLDADFSNAGTWPLRLLLIGYAFNLTAAMPNTASFALGRPQFSTAWHVAQAVICLASWPVLVPRYGSAGAAAGFALSQMITAPVFVWRFGRSVFSMSLWDYFLGVVFKPVAAGAALLAALWLVRGWLFDWTGLISAGAISAIAYYSAGYALLGSQERALLHRLLPGAHRS